MNSKTALVTGASSGIGRATALELAERWKIRSFGSILEDKLLNAPELKEKLAAARALLAMNESNMFYRGMTTWLGFKKKEIFFETATRQGGVSAWSFLHRLNLSLTAITSFSVMPLYFVAAVGLLFFLFSIGLGLQTLYLKFSGQAVSGFTTVILLLLIIGSLLMFSLGIIGEYIARIYQEAKGRPRYVVTEKIRRPTESKGEK